MKELVREAVLGKIMSSAVFSDDCCIIMYFSLFLDVIWLKITGMYNMICVFTFVIVYLQPLHHICQYSYFIINIFI